MNFSEKLAKLLLAKKNLKEEARKSFKKVV